MVATCLQVSCCRLSAGADEKACVLQEDLKTVSTWRLDRCQQSSVAALQETAEVGARKKLQDWDEIEPFGAEKYIVKCQRGLPCMFGTGVCNPSRLEDHCPNTTSQSSVIEDSRGR